MHDPASSRQQAGPWHVGLADHGTATISDDQAPGALAHDAKYGTPRRPRPHGEWPSGVATELMISGSPTAAAASSNSFCSGCTVPVDADAGRDRNVDSGFENGPGAIGC